MGKSSLTSSALSAPSVSAWSRDVRARRQRMCGRGVGVLAGHAGAASASWQDVPAVGGVGGVWNRSRQSRLHWGDTAAGPVA